MVPPPRFELGLTRIRNPVLYPTELRGRKEKDYYSFLSLVSTGFWAQVLLGNFEQSQVKIV